MPSPLYALLCRVTEMSRSDLAYALEFPFAPSCILTPLSARRFVSTWLLLPPIPAADIDCIEIFAYAFAISFRGLAWRPSDFCIIVFAWILNLQLRGLAWKAFQVVGINTFIKGFA